VNGLKEKEAKDGSNLNLSFFINCKMLVALSVSYPKQESNLSCWDGILVCNPPDHTDFLINIVYLLHLRDYRFLTFKFPLSGFPRLKSLSYIEFII